MYKRQVRSRLLYLQPDERTLVELLSFFYDATPLRFLARLMEREDERMLTLLETLEDRDIPVSYTHLDVYKRQLWKMATAMSSTA